MIRFQYYTDAFFYDVEKMVLSSYAYDIPLWGLSRHEFCRALHPDFKDCHQSWSESMGLFFDGETLVAAVLSEGCYDGDAFLLFDGQPRTQDKDLLARMVRFAITHLSKMEDDRVTRTLFLNIPDWHVELRDVVLGMGFVAQDWYEKVNILPIGTTPFEVKLPTGYSFAKGPVPPFYLSNVHRNAFQYGLPHAEKGSKAFGNLRTMRHYDPDLEVVVLDEEGKPAGFAIGWMDESMPYAELEPMAVTWWNRRKGLGKALIHELANRIKAKFPHVAGMTGGDQPFYYAVGYQTAAKVRQYKFNREIHATWDPLSQNDDYTL
jgi:predicted N-acetyltransferase YhbS